jgi:hypothetical protein
MFANKLEEEIYNLYHLGNLQETTLLGSAVEATTTSYNSIQASIQASNQASKQAN